MNRPRLKHCTEQWPECTDGEYNPSCCRFPKSCSCTIYNDDTPPDELEDAHTKGIIVSSIWAQDRTWVIGSGSDTLWHVPDDSAFFKRTTMGAPVIMGRASWEALGRALPGRTNIVITRDPSYPAPGAVVVHSLDEALEAAIRALSLAEDPALITRVPTVWIAGGSRVYAEAMDRVDELVVTELDLDVIASPYAGPLVRAPHIDPAQWVADPTRSDTDWRPRSGDSRWRVTTWVRPIDDEEGSETTMSDEWTPRDQITTDIRQGGQEQ